MLVKEYYSEDKNVIIEWKTKEYHTFGDCYWYF